MKVKKQPRPIADILDFTDPQAEYERVVKALRRAKTRMANLNAKIIMLNGSYDPN